MRAPLLTVLLTLSGSASAFDGSVDLEALRRKAGPSAVEGVAEKAPQGPVLSGGSDLTPFIERLDHLGFDTKLVRELLGKISVQFRAPSSTANAEWGYIRNILYLPDSLKKDGALKADLAANEVSTVIHELTHAAREFVASETAAAGTPAREHYEAVATIKNDVRSEAFLVRYSWWQADEVSGYYMGLAIGEVFEAVDEIVMYNTSYAGAKAVEAGDKLILPSGPSQDQFETALHNKVKDRFGNVSVKDSAMFEGKLIGWEERRMTKDQMYKHVLGLKPPKDHKELLERLNAADNDWARALRAKVLAARKKAAGR